MPPGAHGLPPGPPPGGGRQWSASEAIGFGWNAVMKNFVGLVLGLFVAGLAVMAPIYIVIFGVQFGLGALAGEIDSDVLQILMFSVLGFFGLIALIAVCFLLGGITDVMLRTARGEKTTIGQFFGGARFIGKILGGQIVAGIAVTIGMLLCVVPGVILAIGISLWTFIAIDKNMNPVDAIKASWELTKGHKVSIFVLMLLQFLVALAGELACGVGLLVAQPIILLANAYVYLKLNGEQPRLPA